MLPSFNAKAKATAAANKPAESTDAPSAGSPAVGDIVEGTVDLEVKAWAPPCLMVRMDRGGMGRVCVTEIAEEHAWKTDPLKR